MTTLQSSVSAEHVVARAIAETGRTFTAVIRDGVLFVDDSEARTVRIDTPQLRDWLNAAFPSSDVVAGYWVFWNVPDGHLFTAACVELVTKARASGALPRLLPSSR